MADLAERAGVVTGAASGIGAAVAGRLAAEGAALVLADRDGDGAERVAATLPRARGVAADVSREADVDAAVAACAAEWGAVDFVVANAGRGLAESFADGDPAAWSALLATNVLGAALTLRAGLRRMTGRGSGHLVVVASVSGLATYPGETMYVASKWAVVGMTRALRLELAGTGVRLTLVAPGLVDTPLSRSSPLGAEWLERLAPLQPDDVASAIAYALAQPEHVDVSEIVLRPRGQAV